MSRMLASFNSSLTADPALSKRSFFVTEDVPISDDQQDTTSATPDTIEKAMRYMDKKYNTKFHAWVRNEANICHTCNYMHPVIAEFERGPPHVVHRAVKWLTEGWSVAGTAELIIKLFFHWGIGSEKFSNLVTEVTRSWAVQPYMADLVSTLVVAEDVGQVARFIKHFTNDWEVQSVVDLVSTIASTLKWDAKYYKDFILNFVALERGHKRMTAEEIRRKFELRKQRLRNFKVDSRSGMSGNEFCSTIFGMCVLEVHEIRYLQKLESARKALDSTTIPFQESEAGDSEGRLSPSPFSLSMSSFSGESGLDPDTNFKQTLTASSSSSTLVEESSLLPTSTSWDSLASLETVEAIIAHSRFLLEEHRLETRRQAVLLQIFEQCALSSSALEIVSRVVGATNSFGQREE